MAQHSDGRRARRPANPGANLEEAVKNAVRELYKDGYRTAGSINEELLRRGMTVGRRTLDYMVEHLRKEGRGVWRVATAPSSEAALVLPVLAAVIERTDARVRSVTIDLAEWIAKLRAIDPGMPLLVAYELAWEYVWTGDGDTQHLDRYIAFRGWSTDPEELERYRRVTHLGVGRLFLGTRPELADLHPSRGRTETLAWLEERRIDE